MPTSNLITSNSGTGFTLNVTVCNLLPDILIKDFIVLHAGTPVPAADYNKLSQTSIQYVGSSIGTTAIEVRRRTPVDKIIIENPGFLQRLSSARYNQQLDRIQRYLEEVDLNGSGPGSVVSSPAPVNSPFGVGWASDTFFSATRKAIYDYVVTLATLVSPTFTGTVAVPNTSVGDSTTKPINTVSLLAQIASLFANSPAFGGTPTVPDTVQGTNTGQIINTRSVLSQITASLAGSPVLGTLATAVTQALNDNSTRLATTAFVQNQIAAIPAVPRIWNQFRFTLQTGTPVQDTDTNTNSLFLTPYNGNRISLYNGSAWVELTSAQVTLAPALVASTMYDLFAYNNGGVVTLEIAAWTNTTTRATAISFIDGVPVLSSNNTRRLVGSFYAEATNAVRRDARRIHYTNVDNLVPAVLSRVWGVGVNTYTFTTTGGNYANADATNRIETVQALSGNNTIDVEATAVTFTGVSEFALLYIGQNSSSAIASNCCAAITNGLAVSNQQNATLQTTPAIGFNFFAAIEAMINGTGTTQGTTANARYRDAITAQTQF